MPKLRKCLSSEQREAQSSNNLITRNPYYNHPMMRKGGVHQKSKSALRATARREIRKLTRGCDTNVFHELSALFERV